MKANDRDAVIASVRSSMALSGIDVSQAEAEAAYDEIERQEQLWQSFHGRHLGDCTGRFRVWCECGTVVMVDLVGWTTQCHSCGREYRSRVVFEVRDDR